MEVVYTFGVFDLTHYGHLIALKKAKKMGDKLIIGVLTDDVAESFKRRPIISQQDRHRMISELELGDVIYQTELSPTQAFLDNLGVTVITKAEGAGWTNESIPKWDNIRSVLLPYTEGISTSEIIKRCRQ